MSESASIDATLDRANQSGMHARSVSRMGRRRFTSLSCARTPRFAENVVAEERGWGRGHGASLPIQSHQDKASRDQSDGFFDDFKALIFGHHRFTLVGEHELKGLAKILARLL